MDLFSKVAELLTGLYSGMSVIINAVALVCIAICAVMWVTSSDPQGVRKAKTWLLSILGGLLLYNLAGLIINSINQLAA